MKKSITFALSMLWSGHAFAYLDPGTGSILIQSLIAAIVAGVFAVKQYWYQFKGWYQRFILKKDNESNGPDSSE